MSHPLTPSGMRSLATAIITKLPQELHDIIYALALPPPTVSSIPFARLLSPCHGIDGCRVKVVLCVRNSPLAPLVS
jgi:hypothetical protein